MDEDNKLSNAVKIPVFSSKERDFHVWWVRFQAYCTMKKIAESLKEDFNLPADPKTIALELMLRSRNQKILLLKMLLLLHV